MPQFLFRRRLALGLIGLLAGPALHSDVPRPIPDYARVDALLRRMTLAEKVALIRGAVEPPASYQGQAGFLSGIPRLGIPPLRLADGPPGVLTRVPSQGETATMGVAATFSTEDARANGQVIGREARALGIEIVLEPFINLDRDITFGRGYNTFGEDPLLTGQMGAAEIRGIQAEDVMATAKHYIGYDSNRYNTEIDLRTLHEIYLAPFEAAVDAGVAAVMSSYNIVNGAWASANAATQNEILKGELGFPGFVMSDWGGVHSVLAINGGLDMEMAGATRPERAVAGPRPNYFELDPRLVVPASASAVTTPATGKKTSGAEVPGGSVALIPEESSASSGTDSSPLTGDGSSLYAALRDGTVTEATVTAAARRVLGEMERFGYLDGTAKHTVTPQPVEASARVIQKTAEDAAVLLRNQDRALPLQASDLASLALIGPTAGQVDSIGLFGERATGLVERQVGPLAALRRLDPEAKITYAVADDMTGTVIPHGNFSPEINFTLAGGRALPPNSTRQWAGDLDVPHDGIYWLYLQILGARGRLSVDGKLLGRTTAAAGAIHGDTQKATQDNVLPTTDGLDNVRRAIFLRQGKHPLTVAIEPDTSGSPAQVRLAWMTPEARAAAHAAALEAARSSKTAVVFAWTRRNPVFGLPGDQDALIREVAAVNPHTIVVLNTSQPIALPWLTQVKAVVEMWWPGDEGGWATARILLGQANPAGRLPMTWARRLPDYSPTNPAYPERSGAGVDGVTHYTEGVLVGYRWFDAHSIEPLFPFGFGLSYTHFDYSELQSRSNPDGSATVTVKIRNAGPVAGDEVPQVYLDAPPEPVAGVQFAPRTLAGFTRISLQPGASATATIEIARRAFEYWSVEQKAWRRAAGTRTLWVGASSRDLRLSTAAPAVGRVVPNALDR